MYKFKKIKGIDCPSKFLISKDEEPILFANSKRIASLSIAYLETGNDNIQLPNNTKRYLNKIRGDK